jgi:hypothetical protein
VPQGYYVLNLTSVLGSLTIASAILGVIQEYFLIKMVFILYLILKASFFSPILTGFPHEAVN